MRGILFFAILLLASAASASVVPDSTGWYPLEKEGDVVTKLFEGRVESCLATSAPSVTVRVHNASDGDESSTSGTGPVRVLLYGRDDADNSGLGTPFDYRNTGALFLPTVAIHDVWFCAELRHAYAHLVRSIGVEGEEDPLTELQFFALEEISVREDIRSYLNKETSGRYATALDDAWKQKGTSNADKQIQMLDEVFPPSLSQVEYDIRIEQFRFDLKLGGLVRISEKVGAYISLIQPSE